MATALRPDHLNMGKPLPIETLNSLDFLKFGVVFCRIFPMLLSQLKTEVVTVLGKLVTALVTLSLATGVKPLKTVMITHQVVLFSHLLHGVITLTNSCITGVLNNCGACITPVLRILSV